MKKALLAVLVCCCLAGVGCSRDDNKKSAEVSPSTPAHEQEFTQKAQDKINAIAQGAEEKKDDMAEATETVVDKVVETSEAVKEKAVEVAAKVQEKAVEAKDKTVEMASEVKEKSGPMMEKAEHAAVVVGQSVQETAGKVAKIISPPETVTIDNKNGTVTLPHAKHADAFGCATCHGDTTPGPITLGKDKAHSLCKGCHKEKAKGPTKCSGCHVKKKAAAVEGC